MQHRTKAARRCWNTTAPKSALVKPDYKSITQLEAERQRRENFIKGSNLAAIALCVMFAFLSLGCVMFAW